MSKKIINLMSLKTLKMKDLYIFKILNFRIILVKIVVLKEINYLVDKNKEYL